MRVEIPLSMSSGVSVELTKEEEKRMGAVYDAFKEARGKEVDRIRERCGYKKVDS